MKINLGKIARGILGKVAPILGTAVLGPFGGMAVKKISKALLGHESGTAQEVDAALMSASPEQLAKIKVADQEFEVAMKELDIDLEQIAADDRNSARDMAIKTKDYTPRVLGVLVVAGFFGVLTAMLLGKMPETGSEAIHIMLGALGGMTVQVMNYFFGSSAGSKAKTEHLAKKPV